MHIWQLSDENNYYFHTFRTLSHGLNCYSARNGHANGLQIGAPPFLCRLRYLDISMSWKMESEARVRSKLTAPNHLDGSSGLHHQMHWQAARRAAVNGGAYPQSHAPWRSQASEASNVAALIPMGLTQPNYQCRNQTADSVWWFRPADGKLTTWSLQLCDQRKDLRRHRRCWPAWT